MSITDELRTEARGFGDYIYTSEKAHRLLAIADRIDAEHERQLEVLYRDMSDAKYVELPKDADGEYIHIGDEMEYGKARGHVIALMLSNYPKKWGGGLHWGIQLEEEHAPTALDGLFRHYHAPTVEDVLREFSDKVCNSGHQWGLDAKDTIAEYAAKLRLAGDGKEQQ